MDKRGGPLQRLHQIGLDGILEQGGHGPLGLQLPGGDRLLVPGVTHHDGRQLFLEVGDISGQTENGHDFGGHGDVKPVLPRHAVQPAAQPVGDLPQLPVVHVHAPFPGDAPGIDAKGVALMDMVVQHGGQQVIGRADGVHIAGEMQVDVLHGNDLGIPAAGRAALDAEHRPEGRLPQGQHRLFAQPMQRIAQSYGGGGLALPGGGGRDGRDQYQLAVGPILPILQRREPHLGLVAAVHHQLPTGKAQPGGDVLHGHRRDALGDFNIR